MEHYYYKCFDCGAEYSRKEIELKPVYLCPRCGSVEKNMPLKGVLQIEYDYKEIKKKHTASELKSLMPGRFWQYSYLWPLAVKNKKLHGISENELELAALNSGCVLPFNYNSTKLLVLDETRNPTYSYKDRATTLVVLKAKQMGISKIAAASTGNAGSSLAGICARLGMHSVVFVPKNIPEAKRIQIQSYGSELIMADGDYDLAFDMCLEVSEKKGWYNRNTAYNPLTIEGKKSAAYDIYISTKGKMPDVIFVPAGDGVIIAGLFKGLKELWLMGRIKEIPRLIAVQAEGSSAIARYCETKKFDYKPASSVADSICAGAPRNLYMACSAIEETNGEAVTVTDEEILSAQKYAANNSGMLVEPSSAAALAGYIKLAGIKNLKNKNVMLLFTGSGLKDTSALLKWNQQITPASINKLYE